jgi:hypothetical protein
MAVPSRPHQPRASRTTRARRTTTHAATRAPQCTSHCSLRPLHKRLHLLQAPYRTGARRDRQDASPRGARGGTPRAQATEHALRYPSRAAVQSACRLHSSPACSEPFSPRAPLRPCRLAPARRRSCTARGARVARCARAPPSVQFAVQSACTQHRAHTHASQGACTCTCLLCTPRSPRTGDAARTPRQSPASRRARACRTQYCAQCIIFLVFLVCHKIKKKTKNENKDFVIRYKRPLFCQDLYRRKLTGKKKHRGDPPPPKFRK